MTAASYTERHANALLDPHTPREKVLAESFASLGRIADHARGDSFMVPAVEALGAAIIRVLGMGDTGSIDQGLLDKQVRDTVRRAGGDADAL